MDHVILRELIAALAILISIVAKWRLGSMKSDGWIWTIIAGVLWLIFGGFIQSPMSLLNSIIMIILAIRGWMIWKEKN